ncbi:uncharacterized protein LOC141592981 [Silene latifolia]|uniref:uncharacterized protein LOC141592981 n=1 Tax=Silene latifolia TaxID=37657 RepID=UPI003D77A39C
MRFFRKVAGILGFGSHNDGHDSKDEADDNDNNNDNNHGNYNNSNDNRRNRMNVDPIPAGPRRGFSVPVQVPIDRPAVGPILVPCHGNGGVQGLKWYAERLKTDEDGDVADEFLYQVSSDMPSLAEDQAKPVTRFEVKSNARPAKIKNQALTTGGKLQHYVDCRGQLQWV